MDHISKPKKNFTTRRYDFRLAQHKLDNAHLLVSQTGDRTRTFPRHSFLDERMRDGGRCREKATSKKPRREVAAAAARGSHLDRERKAAGPRSQRSSSNEKIAMAAHRLPDRRMLWSQLGCLDDCGDEIMLHGIWEDLCMSEDL